MTIKEEKKVNLSGINISVILTLIVHTFGLVWFFANLSASVANLQETHKSLSNRVENIVNAQMSKEEILRLHDYHLDRIEKLEMRMRDLERLVHNKQSYDNRY